MVTVATLISGLMATNGEVLASRTIKLSRSSCNPSCTITILLQNCLPMEAPTGSSTSSLVRGVKSTDAIISLRIVFDTTGND